MGWMEHSSLVHAMKTLSNSTTHDYKCKRHDHYLFEHKILLCLNDFEQIQGIDMHVGILR